MRHKAIGTWTTVYPDPIILNPGDTVRLGKEESDNPDWAGWIWAENATHKGWIPVQIVERLADGNGRVISAYSARELEVQPGDEVEEMERMNGWIWARRVRDGVEGWVPLEVLG